MERPKSLMVGILVCASAVCEGQLVPPSPPSDPSSARYTLGDIWNRLSSGAAGTKRGASFAEPTTPPSMPTMKSTDDIMAVAPVPDNTNGAMPSDVLTGRSFWGVRTSGGAWGLATGTRPPAPAQRTGQTQCYDAANVVTPCPGLISGQDGALQKGVPWPVPRFTDNGNGTVRDNLTGLVWLKNVSCWGNLEWQTAMSNVAALWAQPGSPETSCGLTDGSTAGQWRLPTVVEIASLANFGYHHPALTNTAGTGHHTDGDPFTGVQLERFYWTSTTNVEHPSYAWAMDVTAGSLGHLDKFDSGRVWPVRDGQ